MFILARRGRSEMEANFEQKKSLHLPRFEPLDEEVVGPRIGQDPSLRAVQLAHRLIGQLAHKPADKFVFAR